MKDVLEEILKFFLLFPGFLILVFKLKLNSFLKEYRTEQKNGFGSVMKLLEYNYSPFFKIEPLNETEEKKIHEIMIIKRAIDIFLLIFWILVFTFFML